MFGNQVEMRVWLFWGLTAVAAYDYDWSRLHRCMSPHELRTTVADYSENFPCIDCREHLQSLLGIHPFPLEHVKTPEDVRVWTWLTHNLVNERLNKPWESFDIMLECSPMKFVDPKKAMGQDPNDGPQKLSK